MNENDLGRGIGSIVVEFRGGWDWRLWLTARGVCKKRTCLETSCFRVGGQLVFRDELFDFRREEGGFPACFAALMNGVGGGKRGWKKLLRSLENESDVYCAMRKRDREREKKYREKNFENIGEKMVGKMVLDRETEEEHFNEIIKLLQRGSPSFHYSTLVFCSSLSFFLSLFDARSRGFFIDRQRGGEKSREQIRQKGGRKRLDFLREILFANVGDINK